MSSRRSTPRVWFILVHRADPIRTRSDPLPTSTGPDPQPPASPKLPCPIFTIEIAMAKTLYLLDGHAHLYAAYFAIRGLTSPAGEATNAVYGVLRVLLKILRERKPDHWAVVLDPP